MKNKVTLNTLHTTGKSDNWDSADVIRQEGTWLKMFPKVMAALVIDRLFCLKWTNLDKPALKKAVLVFRQEGDEPNVLCAILLECM